MVPVGAVDLGLDFLVVLNVIPSSPPAMQTVALWGGALFFTLTGVVGIRASWSGWRRARRIQDTPTESARAVAMGRTEVSGTVVPAEEPLPQPFRDGDCVIGRVALSEDMAANMVTAAGESEAVNEPEIVTRWVPFYVEDETGRVLVDPETPPRLEVSDANQDSGGLGEDEAVPADLASFLSAPGGDGEASIPDDRPLNARQDVIAPGEEVFVYGAATERPDTDEGEAVIRRDDAIDLLLITDKPEAALTSGWQPETGGGPMGMRIGAVSLLIGILGLFLAALL